ncbi:hypothetical protein AB0C93_34050 [Streptomyces sp. NPDC048518]|uniref:hypothetical protein n=1 Tax=Streptomyces sp. NPDC048518 TaxID=3155029 RepID=UPI0033D7A93B
MDAELAALAAAGATALVQQMVTDGWTQARDRVARFFARDGADGSGSGAGPDESHLVGELDEARAEVVAARRAGDEETAGDVRTEWRSRLRRRLAADPAAADELRSLLAELDVDGDPDEGRGSVVHNKIYGGVHHGTVIQTGSMSVIENH